ncbi:MAG: hypothetical protein J0I95_11185, partial [Microbacterium sp.]|uniref:hydrogen gas-evolving membrane-bound hydrogenase subunit E n=1 Tax=Microbacterium sp. TaxID=51671 RepID=UPI001AC6109D
LQNAIQETLVGNVVSAVLADYHGFDTFGEVIVVFTAGIGVMLLLKGRRQGRDGREGDAR